MVFMGRSRNRPRGGAIQASTRKDGGGSHRDRSDDRDSRSSKNSDNRQFRGRERSRSPISKRPVTDRLGDQYLDRSASDVSVQESLRITVGNEMFREQQSLFDDRFESSLADRLGPPVNRSPLSQKLDRLGGGMDYRGQFDDDKFYKQMDEQYSHNSGRDEIRGSPGRLYRHDRDRDSLERDRYRDSRDRDRHRDLGRRPEDRGRDRRSNERDRERDINRDRHGADQGRHDYDRNSSRESGHLRERDMRSKERSPNDMYSGQSKFPEMSQEPVVNHPPVQPLPPKPLKSILKKSNPVLEPKPESSALFPAGAPIDPYKKEPLYRGPDLASSTQQLENQQKFTHGLPGMSNYMDIEDEEKFLYGEDAYSQRISRNISPDMTLKERYSGNSWGQSIVEKDSLRTSTPDRQQSLWIDKRDESMYRDTESGSQSKVNELDKLMMQQKLTVNPDLLKDKTDMFSYSEPAHRQQPSSQSFMSQSSYESSASHSEQTPTTVVDLLSIFTNKSSSSFLQSSNVTATMNEPRVSESVKPKSANYDPTIENILKSIGFDFEMSKRMQEKAQNKPPEPKLDEMQMGINQTASFLEGGLSEDLKTNLLPKRKEEYVVESLIREAKESVSQVTKALASRENQTTKYMNEEAKHIQREKSGRSPDRRIPGMDYDDKDRKRRDTDSLERISILHRDEPKSRDYHRQSSTEPEFSSLKTSQYTSSTYSDPYNTTANSLQIDPYTTTSQIPPYTSQTDPYNTQLPHMETVPPPSQSIPYSQPYDPRYSAAPMPGQHTVPPPFMHAPPSQYPYGPSHVYPPGHLQPYGPPPGQNPFAPYQRFPPPNVPPYSAPPETTLPVSEVTRLPPPVNATPPGRKGNLISVPTIDNSRESPDFNRSEVKTIELKKSDRKIEEDKKKPLPVSKDVKNSPSSRENSKKDTTRVVSSTKSESNRTVLPPKYEQKSAKRAASDEDKKPKALTEKEKQKLLKEKESRKRRVQSLEDELKRLRRQQNEIMRKKRRQRDGHKDPILLQNSKLQEEITIQINKLRRATEETTRMLKESGAVEDGPPKNKRSKIEDDVKKDEPVKSVNQAPKKQEKLEKQDKKPQVQPKSEAKEKPPLKYEFFDPGGHWCRSCNVISGNVFQFFSHLQGKKHQKSISIYDRPWMTDPGKPEEKSKNVRVVPIKGAEFLMPASAFYCTLCKEFSGDDMCAETHLKSKHHYEKYLKYLEDHQFYEQRVKLDKAAGSSIRKEEKEDVLSENEDKCKNEKVTESKPQEKLSQKKSTGPDKKSENQTNVSKKEEEKVKDSDKVSDKKRGSVDQLKLKSGNKESNKEKEKEEEKTSQETESKAKIAIHISNKTGIKPVKKIPPRKSALLPPWNPVSKQQQTAITTSAPPKKSDVSPASLDTFLTIGEKSKPLPVMKESTGKLLFQNKKIVTAKDILEAFSGKAKESKQTKETNETKEASKPNLPLEKQVSQEEKEDLKMLGIEPESTNLLAIPVPPPPRTQNLSLPKDTSLATSSATDMYNVFFTNEGGTEEKGKTISVVTADQKGDVASISEKESTDDVNKSLPVEATDSLFKVEGEKESPSSHVAAQTLKNHDQAVDSTVVIKPSETGNIEKMDINVKEIKLSDIELPKNTTNIDSDHLNVESSKVEVKDEPKKEKITTNEREKMEVDNSVVAISDNVTEEIEMTSGSATFKHVQEVKTDINNDVKSSTNEANQVDDSLNNINSVELESGKETGGENSDINVTKNKLEITQDGDKRQTENVCSNTETDNGMTVNPKLNDEQLENQRVVSVSEKSDEVKFVKVDEVCGRPEEPQVIQDNKDLEVVSEVEHEKMNIQFKVTNKNDQNEGSDSDSGTVDYDVSEQDIEEQVTESEKKESLEEDGNMESFDATQNLLKAGTENKLPGIFEPEIPKISLNSEEQGIEKQENLVFESEKEHKSTEEIAKEQQSGKVKGESIKNTGNIKSETLSATSESMTVENSDKFVGVTTEDVLKPGDIGISETSLGISESSENLIKEICETVSSDIVPSLEFENTDNSEIDKFSDLFEDNSHLTLQEGGSNDLMGTATLDELEKTITFDDLFSDQGDDGLLNVNSDIVNQGLGNNDKESETGKVSLENNDIMNEKEPDNVDKLGDITEMKEINTTLDQISENEEENLGKKDMVKDTVLEEVSDEEDIVEKTEESRMELDEISNDEENDYVEEKDNLEVSDVSDGEGDQDDVESVHSGVSMEMGSDFEVLDECVDDDEDVDEDETAT